jgi:hypothetical protein
MGPRDDDDGPLPVRYRPFTCRVSREWQTRDRRVVTQQRHTRAAVRAEEPPTRRISGRFSNRPVVQQFWRRIDHPGRCRAQAGETGSDTARQPSYTTHLLKPSFNNQIRNCSAGSGWSADAHDHHRPLLMSHRRPVKVIVRKNGVSADDAAARVLDTVTAAEYRSHLVVTVFAASGIVPPVIGPQVWADWSAAILAATFVVLLRLYLALAAKAGVAYCVSAAFSTSP